MEKKNYAAVTSETLFASRLSDDGYQFSSNRRSNVSRPRFVGLTFGIVNGWGFNERTGWQLIRKGQRILFKILRRLETFLETNLLHN